MGQNQFSLYSFTGGGVIYGRNKVIQIRYTNTYILHDQILHEGWIIIT